MPTCVLPKCLVLFAFLAKFQILNSGGFQSGSPYLA